MVIRYFILFFAFFSKTVGLSSVFSAEMNSACQNTLITAFLWVLKKKRGISPNFCPYYSMTIWRLWVKKLINTILAEFDFFPSKTVIPLFLCNSTSKFQRKSQKIKNNGNQIFYFIFFAFFSNTVGLSSVFSAEMNSACQNTLITVFLWDLEKKAVFP